MTSNGNNIWTIFELGEPLW